MKKNTNKKSFSQINKWRGRTEDSSHGRREAEDDRTEGISKDLVEEEDNDG